MSFKPRKFPQPTCIYTTRALPVAFREQLRDQAAIRRLTIEEMLNYVIDDALPALQDEGIEILEARKRNR